MTHTPTIHHSVPTLRLVQFVYTLHYSQMYIYIGSQYTLHYLNLRGERFLNKFSLLRLSIKLILVIFVFTIVHNDDDSFDFKRSFGLK